MSNDEPVLPRTIEALAQGAYSSLALFWRAWNSIFYTTQRRSARRFCRCKSSRDRSRKNDSVASCPRRNRDDAIRRHPVLQCSGSRQFAEM